MTEERRLPNGPPDRHASFSREQFFYLAQSAGDGFSNVVVFLLGEIYPQMSPLERVSQGEI